MKKRIFRSILLASCAVLLCCLVLIMGVLYAYFTNIQRRTLAAESTLAARGVEEEGQAYLAALRGQTYRLTWVAADGTVLYDTEADAAAMENHGGREEIREALATGTGESQRLSATLAERTLYHAVRLTDGTVLRISVTQVTVLTLLLGMVQPVCFVLLLAVLLSALLAQRLARRVAEPLNRLDLERPLDNDAYDELSPLLRRIESQHSRIAEQVAALQQKQDEFGTITENMNEGLLLLDRRGGILSINRAAELLFHADGGCVGKDILTVERSLPMQKLVREALNGRRSETVLPLAGAVYQLNSTPVLSGGEVRGACVLAFDVTERQQAEARRREFSANVSHELKTPLQTVLGSAELIENKMVPAEELPRFAGRIRSEAARLVTLIDDILRLSQLDEGAAPPREDVDLLDVAEEAVAALDGEASERNVTVTLRGAETHLVGVRRLLDEIVRNLCDNAIRYNVPDGRVDVTVEPEGGGACLTVSDTGIGIPPEAQGHVFERFYRVDKSHSRETGGTGLGLSIVKHAARLHGARIELESAPGRGTRIRVHFPEGGAAGAAEG